VNTEIHTGITDRLFSTAGKCYNKTKSLLPLGLVVVVSFIVRIILFWQDKVIAADGISYVYISRSIFRGEGFAAATHFPPLYPILIGLFSYVTPYDEVAGKVASTILGGLVVIPIYLLGKEVFSKKAGFIASILAALSPTLVAISGIVLSQSTYITILVTALYLIWKSFHANSCKMALAAGLIFGASYLTRPEAIIVLIGVSGVFLLLRPFPLANKDNFKLLLFVWAAFFVVAFPYILLLHKISGTWQLTGKSSVTLADSLGWYLNRPDLKREPGFAGLTYLDIIKNYPDFLWKNPVRNLPTTWAELPPYFWILALLGLLSGLFSPEKLRRFSFLLAALLPTGVIIIFFWIDAHYFSPSLPILYLLGAEGLVVLEKGIRWSCVRLGLQKYGDLVPWGLVVGIVLASKAILPNLIADRSAPYEFSQDGARYDHKLIGLMLKKYLPAKSRVLAKSGRICFYGDFQQVDIPQAPLPDILQTARNAKARYLIADGTLFSSRPQMEPFLVPFLIPQQQIFTTGPFEGMPDLPGGLRLIILFKDPASVGVAVYELPE
jgi:4-amino-4-deoxy-L-arabinose transferase-like glycosyltransferase